MECGLWSLEYVMWNLGNGICVWTMEYRIRFSDYGILSMEDWVWNVDYGIWNMECGIWIMEYEILNMEYEIWNMKCGIWNMTQAKDPKQRF